MSDLTDFLRARIDEMEAEMLADLGEQNWPGSLMEWFRRDCAAKRAIVGALIEVENAVEGYDNDNPNNPPSYWQEWGNLHALRLVADLFAVAYVDHPDYRKEWAVES